MKYFCKEVLLPRHIDSSMEDGYERSALSKEHSSFAIKIGENRHMIRKEENMQKFKDLGLSEKTLRALRAKGFEEPTEIQNMAIPLLLQNEIDIIAQAQTGTGKTAAFALPLIERVKPDSRKTQAIILAPTRELVIQVCEEIISLKGESNLSVAPIYGGQAIELQLKKLRQGVSIIVGTPGRVLDHINRGSLDLDEVQYFILDEADEMLNMGFIEDIEKIFGYTPEYKRVLLLSATMPDRIKKLAEKYMGNYTHLKTRTEPTTDLTDQVYFEVARQDKLEALSRIIDMESDFYGMVFCRTKIEVDELATKLIERNYPADALHGDISQSQREKILGKFRKQQLSILVATDVAARGIDVNNLTHVINYSLPENPEAYIHRIGRTGRAGKQGTAITFITPDEFKRLGFIKRIAKAVIRKEDVPKVSQIVDARKKRITNDILTVAENNEIGEYRQWARELISENPAEDIVAAILKYSFGKTLDASNYRKMTPIKTRKSNVKGKAHVGEQGKTRLFIARGKNTKTTKENLLTFIEKKAGTARSMIENIEIQDTCSFITVPCSEAEFILKKFKKSKAGKESVVKVARPARKSVKK